MFSLQREVEWIFEYTGDCDCFITNDQFSRTYQLSDDTLSITKVKDLITVAFADVHFEFKHLKYNPSWYPIQVVKNNEVISIVIDYENGRAYSARNYNRFWDLAEEIGKMIAGMNAEVLGTVHEPINEKTLFEQMSFW
ncbi:hypothetical protein [Desulfosporosinus sp. OT]|uniref:hypothetical protein n=1 Tax=Desulfosporosinus sp. OT TaxID=913865 RepID=UPI000223A8AB|nr:hypothetical protein [Desulfosporosinus sp. OT]EGW40489.1 hypothetical protein DOT_1561 [Desulfosporosinus sp. OT]